MRRLACLLLALVSTACGGNRPAPDEDPVLVEGARLYRTYCGLCHGDRGEGYAADAASALMHPEFLRSATDDFIRHAVADGRPGTAMAAYARRQGGPLSNEEIDAIVRYLRSKGRRPVIDRNVTLSPNGIDARPIYERECASCHGERGQGGTALSLNNPTFGTTVDDAFIRHAIAVGRAPTPMPAFGTRMTAPQLDALTAYVRNFSRAAQEPERQSTIPADLPVVLNPQGAAPQFTLREGRFVPAAQVAQALAQGRKIVIVDARPPSEWSLLRIPGAIPVPYYAVPELVERLPDDGTWIVAYCACPHAASGHVVDALRERGFEHTAVLDEGILVWRELGHPVAGSSVEE